MRILQRAKGLVLVTWACGLLICAGCAKSTDTVRAKGTDESLQPLGREIAWLGDLHQPEGVKYDPDQDVFFISNMVGYGSDHDRNGYIVEVSAGNLANAKVFAENGKAGTVLDAPKGMTLHGDTLWVADIDVLRGFNRKTGLPIATIDLRPLGAVLLNDVTIGGDGVIYITDTGILMTDKGVIYTGPDRIFAVKNGKPSVFAEGKQLARPNGIVWDKERKTLVVVSFDPFHSDVYSIAADGSRRSIASGNGKFDGVEPLGRGRFLVASWNDSSVRIVGAGFNRRVASNVIGPADIGFDTKRNRLAVPIGLLNQVQLWQMPSDISN